MKSFNVRLITAVLAAGAVAAKHPLQS